MDRFAVVNARIVELQQAITDCDCQSEEAQILRLAALALIRTYQRIQSELEKANMTGPSDNSENCNSGNKES